MEKQPYIKKTIMLGIEALTNRDQYPDTDLEIWAETDYRPQAGDIIHLGNNSEDENLVGVLVHSCRMVVTTEEIQYSVKEETGLPSFCRSKYETTTAFLITGELVSMVRVMADIEESIKALMPDQGDN